MSLIKKPMPLFYALTCFLPLHQENELEKRGEAASELNQSMEKLAKKLRLSKLAMAELNRRRANMAR
jgi:hypothetical protein